MDERQELRLRIARALEARASSITRDAVAPMPRTSASTSELPARLLQALVVAIREDALDAQSLIVTDLRRLALGKAVRVRSVFELLYLLERAALDELAADESFGETSEPWPAVALAVRRASVELSAAFAECLTLDTGADTLIDAMTTLHTRGVLLAVLEKEIKRTLRFGHPFALIVFGVDPLTDLNARHGYALGDRLLERIGIVIRSYFREQDWVTRCAGDGFAVVLPETGREPAEHLAEHLRETVYERLALRDYLSGEEVMVTMSAAVVIVDAVDGSTRAEPLLTEAERAVARAQQAGRNRVERVDATTRVATTPPQ